MRLGLLASLTCLAALVAGLSLSQPSPEAPAEPATPVTLTAPQSRFVVFGDMPYHWPQDLPAFRQLLAAINQVKPQFVINVGDIKNGTSYCGVDYYQALAREFKRIKAPLIYTPGDNEWTDCRRWPAGHFRPEERLKALRDIFFTKPMLPELRAMTRQPDVMAGSPYIENALWQQGDTLFATVHVVGSRNNAADHEEWQRRETANEAWLAYVFAQATTRQAASLVLAMHGDPMFDCPADQRPGFQPFLMALETQLGALPALPVLLIHGDSHRYWQDQPWPKKQPQLRRLIVPGDTPLAGVVLEGSPPKPLALVTPKGPTRLSKPAYKPMCGTMQGQ